MYISYYDETGDDGFPKYSSKLFVLTAVYTHNSHWKENHEKIHKFRRTLKEDYGLPVSCEMHTKYFLLNKKPFRQLELPDEDRLAIIDRFCDLIAEINVKTVNVVIDKTKIKSPKYNVLDSALTYSVQRIENDLRKNDPDKNFLIITDEGRVGKMRSTTRRVQQFNYIPSKYYSQPYRDEIKLLIEDPLPKDSKESHFIQIADLISYIVFLYSVYKFNVGKLHNRLSESIDQTKVVSWMEKLKKSLNTEASSRDPYGVVCYPQ